MKLNLKSTGLASLALLISLSALGSCAAVGDQPEREKATWRNPVFGAEVFASAVELGEIDFDDDLETILGSSIEDVERQRAGVRVSLGSDYLRAFVQFFAEEIDEFDSSQLDPGSAVTIDDLFGIGIGVVGSPTIKKRADGVRIVTPYRVGINIVSGEGRFTDATGATLLKSTTEDGDLAYIEQEVSVGVGVNSRGFQATIGLFLTNLSGLVDDEIVTDTDNDDLKFEGSNAGPYFELGYSDPGSPMNFGVRGIVGGVQGVEAFFGVAL